MELRRLNSINNNENSMVIASELTKIINHR